MNASNHRGHTFELSGGVGNQLFQIHAALKFSRDPVFDISMLRPPFMRHGSSAFRVLDGEFETVDRYNSMGAAKWRIWNAMETRLSRIAPYHPVRGYITEVKSGYDEKLVSVIANNDLSLRVRGYFQSYKYLDFIPQGHGCESFRQPDRLSDFGLSLLDSNKPWAFLHIRRGDFLLQRETVGILGKGYYEAAVAQILDMQEVQQIVVFSDDIYLASKTLSFLGDKISLLFAPKDLNFSETLFLMSQANACILGNSTFSFWGAAKNPRAATVVTPRPWFKSAIEPSELIPPHWIQLSATWE